MSGARFKGVTSIDDMLGYQSDSFKELLKIDSNGVSAFTMEQIKAKAATLGLTDSLTAQAVALASDADFTAKAATGKLTFGKAFSDTSLDIEQFGKLVKNSGKLSEEQIKVLTNAASRGTDAYKGAIKNILSENVDLADSFIDLSTISTESTGKVKNTFKGLGATIKSFATSTAGITTIILGSMLAIGALVDQFDELSYTELQDKFEQSSSSYESAKSEVESVKSELESVNSQIDAINAKPLTLSSEAELAGLQAQKSELEQILTLKENIAEAAKNQSAYDALNASNAKTSATNTITAGTTDSSKTVLGLLDWYYGDSGFAKTLRLFNPASTENLVEQWNAFTDQDLLTLDSKKLSDFRKQEQELIDWFNSDEGQAATQKNTDVFKSKQEELQKITSGITELQTDIAEKQATISSQIEAMTDETTGEALPGFENRVASLRDTLNEISHLETIDMTDLEKSFNAIDKYFGQSSTSNLKSYFQELANEGKLTADAIEDIGISASTIGTDNLEDVVRYFNDMATAATEASTAIDGSFEGVQTAFESENQGAEWTAMADYVTQLQDLYESGKVGTDEFQSGVQYFMPKVIDEDAYKYDADAYVAAWESARKKIERYFDAENPLESMTNFTNDLIDAGKASQSGDDITWKFKTTAEAADALDLSVQSVEAAMHNLEDYGAEFDDVMFSGEGLERYESALENIKSLYDSMDEGESKDRLGGLIDNWDLELEKYQDDMSSLTEDQIVHIEFEYDLASIQQQIDQVMSLINNGDTSVENYAQVLAGNQQYIQTAESGVGFDTEGVKIPVEYVTNEDTISTLQEQLKSVTSEEEKIAIQAQIVNLQEVQKDLLNAFSDAHSEINAESSMDEINDAWNAFVNGTDGANGKEIIANIVAKDDEGKQAVADLLGIDVDDIDVPVKADTSEAKRDIDALVSEDKKTIVMDVNANTSDIEEALDNLQQGQTLYFTAKVDGKETGVAASFDETGEITYTANINDVEVSLDKVKDEEGNITYTADYDSAIDNLDIEATVDYLIGNQESPDTKEALVDYIKNHQDDPEFRTALMNYLKAGQDDPDAKTALLDYIKNNQDNADDQNAIVNYFKGSQDNPDSPQSGIVNWGLGTVTWPTLSLTGIINWISGGGSRLSGTAHANGTAERFPIPSLSGRALAMGTLQDDSWLDPNWQTKHSEVALTGEEGQELVVTRANRWFTVGDHGAEFVNIPQGSIVFDAHQTKELLSKGRINSRGTAMIGGTAFANGWRLPSASSSSSSSSSSSKSSSSSGSSSSSSNSTSTKSAEKAADKFEEIVDSIEILLDRMDRTLQQLTDSIETYSYDLSKQSAMSDKAMSAIRSNLTTLQQAYNGYIQEANSVGLSDSWKKIVQNGKIDITTITDEDLKNKIDEYQQWLRFSGHLIYFIAGTSPQPCFATT